MFLRIGILRNIVTLFLLISFIGFNFCESLYLISDTEISIHSLLQSKEMSCRKSEVTKNLQTLLNITFNLKKHTVIKSAVFIQTKKNSKKIIKNKNKDIYIRKLVKGFLLAFKNKYIIIRKKFKKKNKKSISTLNTKILKDLKQKLTKFRLGFMQEKLKELLRIIDIRAGDDLEFNRINNKGYIKRVGFIAL